MSDPRAAEILRLDEQRRAALIAGDFATLDRLLADDLVHVHGTGLPDGKAHYFRDLRESFEFVAITRGETRVRLHGEAAIVTGPMIHKVRLKADGKLVEMAAYGTQIWERRSDGWRLVFYQATPVK
ncbi:MAG TPA: nuclear transport factor 2 family protein [Alphaproteobacteria bacterium]|nr:nuclear transport factor 2 family protein [Alphaproteobacteria bacterium]